MGGKNQWGDDGISYEPRWQMRKVCGVVGECGEGEPLGGKKGSNQIRSKRGRTDL